jgi:transcription initiation factor TFIIB
MSIAQPFPLANPYGSEAPAPKVELPKQDLAVRLICPECRDTQPNIEEEFSSGDLVCRGCGLVLGDKIVDTRSECEFPDFWGFFALLRCLSRLWTVLTKR